VDKARFPPGALEGKGLCRPDSYADCIRRKLKITNQQVNLTGYLQSLAAPEALSRPEESR